MKNTIKIIITIGLAIYALYFINKQCMKDGLIGFIYSAAAVAIVGAGYYSLLWSSDDKKNSENKTTIEDKRKSRINKDYKSKDNDVIVTCSIIGRKDDDRIRIWDNTYLLDKQSNFRSYLKHVKGITIYPEWTTLRKEETMNFVLFFEKLPSNCIIFDLLEDIPESGGFYVKDIVRNQTDRYSIDV